MSILRRVLPSLSACVLLCPGLLSAQAGYRSPPPEVVQILEAPQAPLVTVGPDRRTLVLVHRVNMPSIEEQSQPMLRLAGRRINPLTNGRFNPSVISGLSLMDVESGVERPIDVPAGGGWSMPTFSPSGERFAFERATRAGTELWIGSVEDGTATRLLGGELNGVFGRACDWLPRTDELVCRLVPGNRGAPPAPPMVPQGPVIQESEAKSAPVRTYQDLLGSPHDADVYDYYATAQLALVHAATGTKQVLADAAVYGDVEISPSGSYLLVERLRRPYSYLVPDRLFARDVEIWNMSGHVIRTVHEIALGDEIPIGGVYDGPRGHGWMEGSDDVLSFVTALDGGDPRAEVPVRDRLVAIGPPFDGEGEVLAETQHRFMGLVQGQGHFALLSEYDRPTRALRTWRVDMGVRPLVTELLWERNSEDRYNDPGTPVMDPWGKRLLQRDNWIYLEGAGASDEGDRPFLDRMDIRTGRTERLFQSGPESYETVVAMLDDRGRRVLTSHESKSEPPNYFVRDLRGGEPTVLTRFTNPAEQLSGLSKEFVVYEREDGVQLSGTLYLPPGYEGGRLPTVVWAYPREYSNADIAGQVRGSPNRFPRISGASHLLFLTQGYAVFDGPTMPIVGGDVANDTYVEQLVASAKAAVDKVVSMGVADPDRIGIGGHSYGAFMTANLLAHSDLFQAGIARSGAYNRTLTPFGFQSERRTFWEASELYFEMSPFMQADQINEPMLMIHGEADNNSGTFPIQSERMYHAMKGLGGKARLVVLPSESHGYQARESVFHALAEMIEWFDRYVKKQETQRVTTF
ncbi:MAG: prolyl oligopeptidase family serine peptidase [Gemmatimonadota bacterium]|nr:prolyl oligopeptidase family serine peptidase [Gemmatimonadota bacterium]